MSKVRFNFLISQELHRIISDIATEEESSASDVIRRAIKFYIENRGASSMAIKRPQTNYAINCSEEGNP